MGRRVKDKTLPFSVKLPMFSFPNKALPVNRTLNYEEINGMIH